LYIYLDKGGDAEIFKALSVVHSILSDTEQRKIYDETGDINGGDMKSGDFDDWYNYFRNLFPKVTVDDIEKFSSTYKGSDEEKNDIIEAYYQHDGNFRNVMECVILAEDQDEDRITNIINTAIADGEVELLPSYKKRYSSTSSSSAPQKKKQRKGKSTAAAGKRGEDDLDSLAEMIRSKNQRAASGGGNAFSSIFAKYGGGDDTMEEGDDVDDAEFDRIRASLGKKQASASGGGKKKGKKGK
jgi:DnaJ homolog subfamily C member 9